jgi:uncharacterized protein (TIGR02145 family)
MTMKIIFFVLAIFAVLNGNAQNFFITFKGSGASTTISTVKVENLNSGSTITLNGSDILRLSGTVGISEPKQLSGIKIYPNPIIDNSRVEIIPPVAGNAVITVFDISSKPVAQIQSYLEKSIQEFRLSGIGKGFYFINVRGSNYQLSGKFLSNERPGGKIKIEKISSNIQALDDKTSKTSYKGIVSFPDMTYSAGDRLKFTGKSGKLTTIITDIPTKDKIITFNFIPCTDGDNNNYPVVQIDTHIWMAENLKTTRYNDGTAIPLVVNDTAWHNDGTAIHLGPDEIQWIRSTPGYCWYNNDSIVYKNMYGALYNWYAVNTDKLCPKDWHAPSHEEWLKLTDYLGGEDVAGGKLKEANTTHWGSPNAGATNESGFTALPGGFRYVAGTFHNAGDAGYWWSSTNHDWYSAWSHSIIFGWEGEAYDYIIKMTGFSVRCLKD